MKKNRLIDDLYNKNQMIKVLSNQNKKLLKEIKMKYNKDLNFIEDIQKFGIDTNMSNKEFFEEIKNRYENNNDNISENGNENDIKEKNKFNNLFKIIRGN